MSTLAAIIEAGRQLEEVIALVTDATPGLDVDDLAYHLAEYQTLRSVIGYTDSSQIVGLDFWANEAESMIG